jgi:hypothetical protein
MDLEYSTNLRYMDPAALTPLGLSLIVVDTVKYRLYGWYIQSIKGGAL